MGWLIFAGWIVLSVFTFRKVLYLFYKRDCLYWDPMDWIMFSLLSSLISLIWPLSLSLLLLNRGRKALSRKFNITFSKRIIMAMPREKKEESFDPQNSMLDFLE
jgi:hypothetical protein